MFKKFEYLIYILLATVSIGIIPNLILRPFWIQDSSGAAILSILLNSIIIPLFLLLSVSWINSKFEKDWWILNFVLIIAAVSLSVYMGFLNWAVSGDNIPGSWGINNVDRGTKMILNLELMIGFAIVGVALLFKIFTKIKLKRKNNN